MLIVDKDINNAMWKCEICPNTTSVDYKPYDDVNQIGVYEKLEKKGWYTVTTKKYLSRLTYCPKHNPNGKELK